MPLNLHRNCRQRLVETLAAGLPKITTDNGMFLEFRSSAEALLAAEKVIPTTGDLRNRLTAYVDDFPVFEFIRQTLAIELRERDQYLADTPSVKLTDLHGYEDVVAVAQSLVERFESLPWQYKLSLRMPNDVNQVLIKFVTDFPLSTTMRLIHPTEEFVTNLPQKTEDEKRNKRIHGGGTILGGPSPDPEWNENAVYLQIDVEGFIDMYGVTRPASDAKAHLREFCGLGLALGLFKIKRTYDDNPFALGVGTYKSQFLVHKKENDVWSIDGKFDLDDASSKAFKDIRLEDFDGDLKTEVSKISWAARQLQRMYAVFSGGDKAARIARASEWLFDSHTGDDELLSFIQSIVVLEILLGDKEISEEIGLSELLRNRCAYLIGKSHQQRSELLRDFREIYRVRSKIVHTGKRRLTPDERRLFYVLRSICRRVIQEEIDLLEADLKEAK